MIPHSRLSDQVFELRERVTACRKRVRLHRHRPKAAATPIEKQRAKQVPAVSRTSGYTEDGEKTEGVASDHEVGIT